MALPGSNPTLDAWTNSPWLLLLYAGGIVAVVRGWVRGTAQLYAAVLLVGGLCTQNAIIRLYTVHQSVLKFPWSGGNEPVGMEPTVERTLRDEVYVWVPLIAGCILCLVAGDLWRRERMPQRVPRRRRFGRRA